jgi:hypothetical protein
MEYQFDPRFIALLDTIESATVVRLTPEEEALVNDLPEGESDAARKLLLLRHESLNVKEREDRQKRLENSTIAFNEAQTDFIKKQVKYTRWTVLATLIIAMFAILSFWESCFISNRAECPVGTSQCEASKH